MKAARLRPGDSPLSAASPSPGTLLSLQAFLPASSLLHCPYGLFWRAEQSFYRLMPRWLPSGSEENYGSALTAAAPVSWPHPRRPIPSHVTAYKSPQILTPQQHRPPRSSSRTCMLLPEGWSFSPECSTLGIPKLLWPECWCPPQTHILMPNPQCHGRRR